MATKTKSVMVWQTKMGHSVAPFAKNQDNETD